MRKGFTQVMVGLVVVLGLILGPMTPNAMAKRHRPGLALGCSHPVPVGTAWGWDHGGSPGS